MHTYKPKTKSPVFTFLVALSATAIGVVPLSGQTADTTRWRVSTGQFASAGGGMSLSLVPSIFSINGGLPSCAPCDPATLPGIDRWAVSTERSAWGIASWVGEFGLVASTWYELYKLPNGTKHLAASVEAAAWNFGMTRLAKAVFNRNRPVLYTEDGIEGSSPELCVKVRGSSSMLLLGCLGDLLRFEKREIQVATFAPDRSSP